MRDAIGVVGFRTELVLLDRFGLVDRRSLASAPSPGHERFVSARWFLPREPDYLNAWLVPAGAPPALGVDATLADLFEAGRAVVESSRRVKGRTCGSCATGRARAISGLDRPPYGS